MERATPFLKWPGGKQRLVGTLVETLPRKYGRYFEPFLGGAALFFHLGPTKARLSDINPELVQAYVNIRDSVGFVIRYLRRMKYSRRDYYRIRALRPRNPYHWTARLVYLNKTCWNGLYRVNSQGQFNVPIGKYVNPTICDSQRLRLASAALRNAECLASDFEESVAPARKGDIVYLDPPYQTTRTNNGFLKYNSRIFSWSDQLRLARVFATLDRRGCYLVLTNANHPQIKELYKAYTQRVLRRRSLIAADNSKRRFVTELLVTNFTHKDG